MTKLRIWLITNPLAALVFLGFYLHGKLASRSRAHHVEKSWSRRLLAVAGIRVEVRGAENIRAGGPFVLVSNHQSLADTPLLLANLPCEFRFLAKKSLFRAPIIGGQLAKCGHIPVAREDARSAAHSLAECAEKIRSAHISVLVFAEGTRSEEGMRAFKSGAAHLAIQTGAPVVPITVEGTAAILPKDSFCLRPGSVRLTIGEPIATRGLTRQNRDELTHRIQEAVLAQQRGARQNLLG
jgi:1-acyl-sn-glycerol-3-phosphate acyltransferase